MKLKAKTTYKIKKIFNLALQFLGGHQLYQGELVAPVAYVN